MTDHLNLAIQNARNRCEASRKASDYASQTHVDIPRHDLEAILNRIDELGGEVEEINGLFDRLYAAGQRGIARWREGHPERELVIPDRADLVVWLLDRMTEAQRAALQAEINGCRLCGGKGTWETSCSMCGDSTFDHACDSETMTCDRCAPARAKLAALGPPAQEPAG